MIKSSHLLKHQAKGGAFNELINVHAALDNRVLITKSGHLLSILKVQGSDFECRDPSEVDEIARRFEAGARLLDERFTLQQYLIKRPHSELLPGVYANSVAQEAAVNRLAYLNNKDPKLSVLDIYFVISVEPAVEWVNRGRRSRWNVGQRLRQWRSMLSTEATLETLDEELRRHCSFFLNQIEGLIVQLRDFLDIDFLDKRQVFHFLRGLLNFSPCQQGVELQRDEFIDFQACSSSLECYRDHLRLDSAYIKVLTLKDMPAHTIVNMLNRLQTIPYQFILMTEWTPIANSEMRRVIQSKRRHFFNSKVSILSHFQSSPQSRNDVLVDDSASAIVADLGSCLEELEFRGKRFGHFSLSLVLHDDDLARLQRGVGDCVKVFSAIGAQLIEERSNLLNAYLAVLPANFIFNLRKHLLLETNHADLSLLFAVQSGKEWNAHLGTEYLTLFETNQGTPYYFNLHYEDVANVAIIGSTGSGKSFTLAYLITHLQKFDTRTVIFDLAGSYQDVAALFRGAYMRVGLDNSGVRINPFSLPPTPENVRFLSAFFRVLIESSGCQLSSTDGKELHDQIQNLYVLDAEQRRLLTLSNILPRSCRQALAKWVQGGAYGSLFDNSEDTLTFSPFQVFDFEGMDRVPQVLEPLLFYVLHRAQTSVESPTLRTVFKTFVLDEAWKFLKHPTIRSYVLEGLKTWRKLNAGVILATQSGDDLLASEMLSAVVESCPTKMFLANPGMDRKVYQETFHLNETEAELIAGLIPKRQILVKRPGESLILNLNVSSKEYWTYTNNPHDREKKRVAFDRYGFAKGLEILTRSEHP